MSGRTGEAGDDALVGRATRLAAHALVNELAAIRLQAEAIARTVASPTDAERVAGIVSAAGRTARALRELQALAQGDTQPVARDLRELVEEIAPLLHAMAGPRAQLVLDMPDRPVPATIVVNSVRRLLVAQIATFLDRPGRRMLTVRIGGDAANPVLLVDDGEVELVDSTPPEDEDDAVDDVLVVEDDPHMRDLLLRVLGLGGRRARALRDAESALGDPNLRGGRVRLLLADVHLPGMSGPELARQVATWPDGPEVVLMSGDVLEESSTTMLRKPFGMNELLSLLDDRLGASPDPD